MAKSKYKVANMDELPTEQALMEKASEKKFKKTKKTEEFGETSLSETTGDISSETVTGTEESSDTEVTKSTKPVGFRSKRYVQAKSTIDRKKSYQLPQALKLVKEMATTKFDESVELHLVLKEIVSTVEVSYPHSTGKTVRVEIFSDDTILKLDKGTIDFDILLASPAQMGKLTKYARVLGPKGLMPNPKNGTLIADPVKRKKDLESGKSTIRGEKKSPLLHARIGKVSMQPQALEENIQALLAALQGKTLKAVICSSMGPGIKILI